MSKIFLGQTVKILKGPWMGHDGKVKSISQEQGKEVFWIFFREKDGRKREVLAYQVEEDLELTNV